MYKKVSACVYNYSKLARDMNGEWSMVLINGRDLTVEEVIRVCRNDEEVKLTDEAEKNVQKYGLDTVFPALTTLYYDALTGKTGRAASEEEN